jgi:ketosteroid isomerase-like protein
MWNVFEQPWTLLIAAATALLVVAVIHPFIQAKSKRRLWLIPLLLAAAAPLLDFAVQTDREKIQTVMAIGVKAVENEDCTAIASIIAPDYRDSAHSSKEELLRRCRVYLQPPAVDKVYGSLLDMNISGSSATLTMLDRILIDPQSRYAQLANIALVKLSIDLKKTPDGNWLITRAEILTINNQPAKWTNINYENW